MRWIASCSGSIFATLPKSKTKVNNRQVTAPPRSVATDIPKVLRGLVRPGPTRYPSFGFSTQLLQITKGRRPDLPLVRRRTGRATGRHLEEVVGVSKGKFREES